MTTVRIVLDIVLVITLKQVNQKKPYELTSLCKLVIMASPTWLRPTAHRLYVKKNNITKYYKMFKYFTLACT